MAIPYDKEMREAARARDQFLIQISIDGKYLSEETRNCNRKTVPCGRFQTTGPMSVQRARELWRLYRKWQKEDDK